MFCVRGVFCGCVCMCAYFFLPPTGVACFASPRPCTRIFCRYVCFPGELTDRRAFGLPLVVVQSLEAKEEKEDILHKRKLEESRGFAPEREMYMNVSL